ncbi:hypothetical protein BS78_04G262300 [Paspalum vaginatum]|nr:hypothetical protein BS78_04G262300 [Paspalum vaginatum]
MVIAPLYRRRSTERLWVRLREHMQDARWRGHVGDHVGKRNRSGGRAGTRRVRAGGHAERRMHSSTRAGRKTSRADGGGLAAQGRMWIGREREEAKIRLSQRGTLYSNFSNLILFSTSY